MNIRILRNLSLMSIMVGAMFLLNSNTAQAQNLGYCDTACFNAMEVCINSMSSECGPTAACYAAQSAACQATLNQCMFICNIEYQ